MGKPTKITSLLIPTETITAARTLLAGDSGKTFMLNLAGGFTVTLPALGTPINGWYAKFIVKTAPTTAYIVKPATGDEDTIKGNLNSSTGQTAAMDFETAGGDQVNFVANQAVAGDYIDITTDGVVWFVEGSCTVIAGLTITG